MLLKASIHQAEDAGTRTRRSSNVWRFSAAPFFLLVELTVRLIVRRRQWLGR